jgi:ornithine cyclodeaminase/alanine dehydrogenase-like protein (mu-crystallin family)
VAVPFVDAGALGRLLPMPAAIDALHAAFGAPSLPEAPLRTRVEGPDGELLLMPAVDAGGMGVKLVTVNPANPGRGLPFIHAVYALFEGPSLAPAALVDGSALTALRTAAVSGLATRLLARADAERLVIFGAGVQAGSHLRAMLAERPVRTVTVISRTAARAEALARTAREAGVGASVGDSRAVAGADLICTCTTSAQPLFDGALLPEGVHVNAVGSYQPVARELDERAVLSSRVVVETREAALAEAGEVAIPVSAGALDPSSLVELAEVVRGRTVRAGPADRTLFKSVGVAFEDLVVARAVAAALAAG